MGSYNERYFYLGGAISFALFAVVVLLFALLLSAEKAKSFAMIKDNYVSVSISMQTLQRARSDAKKPKPTPKSKPKESVAETPTPSPAKAPDIASLFSDVKTQKIVHKKKTTPQKIDNQRLSAIEKRLKTVSKKENSAATQKIKELRIIRPDENDGGASSSTASEVNEYLARIQAFVYSHFYPPPSTEGSIARVYLSINAAGMMTDFRILKGSGNTLFDSEVEQLEKRLRALSFPKHPKSKPQNMEIYLIAEEK